MGVPTELLPPPLQLGIATGVIPNPFQDRSFQGPDAGFAKAPMQAPPKIGIKVPGPPPAPKEAPPERVGRTPPGAGASADVTRGLIASKSRRSLLG